MANNKPTDEQQVADLIFERACPDYLICDLCGHDAHHCGGGNYECTEGHAFAVSERYFGRGVRIVPEGWVAVPVEPTGDMLARIKLSTTWTTEALTVRYKDMLSAAPRAPYTPMELQERRKASSEPYGFTDGDRHGMVYEPRHAERLKDPRPLYCNPPAPVVPDYSTFEQWWESQNGKPLDGWESLRSVDGYFDDGIDGQFEAWSAGRASMLQGQSEPAPKPSGMSGIVPDYEGVALTQRECYMAGKKAGLDEAGSSHETPDGYVVEKLAEGDE